MKISLAVKYIKLPQDCKTPEDLSRFLITESVSRRYPQGMPRTESRLYAKLLDQFYQETKSVDVDEPTFLLIKESLDKTDLPAAFSSWKWALLDYLEKLEGKK